MPYPSILHETTPAATGRKVSRPYGDRLRRFNACLTALLALLLLVAAMASAEAKQRILAFGDSLTAGYGLAEEDTFPVRLEAALREAGIAASVTNAGVSGDTTTAALKRIDWLLQEDYDLVIVELGANDGLRGIDPNVTRINLDRIVGQILSQGPEVLLAGMKAPPNLGRDFGSVFNDIYSSVARKYDVAHYPFFLDGVAGRPELNQDDGMHPNAKGVAIIVERMLPSVIRALGKDAR